MGVRNQLLFGNGPGLFGGILATAPPEVVMTHFGERTTMPTSDFRRAGAAMVKEHNDWCIRASSVTPRILPVPLVLTDDLPRAIAETERVLAGGARVVLLPSDIPPGGVSPANPLVDPLWRTIAEAGATVLLHVGSEFGFVRDLLAWRNAPAFHTVKAADETALDTYTTSSLYLSPQNFLTTMVLGGVFDRFPTLRLAAVELGAGWIGPLMVNLQLRLDNGVRKSTRPLDRTIREYFQDNVRVSPMFFEPIDDYLDWYGLDRVYCFGSDYPHIEGGVDPITTMAQRLAGRPPEVTRQFFVDNARFIFDERNVA
jgi:predicted TIM-barrel fold metal-dependent hydrolase